MLNDKVTRLDLKTKEWNTQYYIYNELSEEFVGSKVEIRPTTFMEYTMWFVDCTKTSPSYMCGQRNYQRAQELHYSPSRWSYDVMDIMNDAVKGPWAVVDSDIVVESNQTSLAITETLDRGGYTIYKTDWSNHKELAFITNKYDENLKINSLDMKVRIDYYQNQSSQLMRVFYKYKSKDGVWFESPVGPTIFCNNCSNLL